MKTAPKRIALPKPQGFSFLATVLGHGWHELPPFTFDPATRTLTRARGAADGGSFTISDNGDTLVVQSADGTAWSDVARAQAAAAAARMLSFDADLAPFAASVRGRTRYDWAVRSGFGQLLVSPSVWEDLAKTLLTTNTTWAVTTKMVTRLCALGDAAGDGAHAFPTAERIAAMPLATLETEVRAGYRTPYLHALARAIATGAIDPESWRDPALPSANVLASIRALMGFGPYAAAASLRLLGRHDMLAIDSALRDVFSVQIAARPDAGDDDIHAYYAPFGRWRGLVAWADIMKVHLEPLLDTAPS